jgi:hypothetical protein
MDYDERSFPPSPDTKVSSTPLSNCFIAITSGLIATVGDERLSDSENFFAKEIRSVQL